MDLSEGKNTRPLIGSELGLKLILWFVFIYIFTKSAWGTKETFSFGLGLVVGGPILGGLLGTIQVRYYRQRLVSNTIKVPRAKLGIIPTPENLGLILLFIVWAILAPFAVPSESFTQYGFLVRLYRFFEGALAVFMIYSVAIQGIWAVAAQKRLGKKLILDSTSA
jgi:hypothetical protein